ncbi:MAG: ATP-dependent Clp protease ATP-binding subunit, partial [Blastocatellia bacterium]|nr:ATP-dependent Clp protease ATP-binding subunit [Blastocatellia bacterium]
SLPIAIDLQCRYVSDAALPGKVSLFLQQLAVKHKYSKIDRETIIEEFHAKSGLSVSFLDGHKKLERAEVVTALSKEIVGQKAVIEAASDVISIAKARLNDPDRPLASFLFLGPTGVGKTQSAKAIAKYLFGDAEKMLRFDMNEFVSANSVTKLVGNFSSPEGLLTSAVRRQPFSVILLDEIEKAHRDLFDLLLQVIGEGRLTDAIGRTVDFTNTIIILTSNLGVKEANATLGFHKEESSEKASYVQAARKFFRPEFFNRIDRIVPFDRLNRKDIDSIARKLIAELFTRDGLVRRKCIVQIEEFAMEKIIDQGYHPALGARALKRAIERQLTQPIASQLVNLTKDSPAVVTVLLDGEAKNISDIKVQVDALTEVVSETITISEIPSDDQQRTIDRIATVLERIDKKIAILQPTGAINTENVSQEHKLYFALREQSRRVTNIITKASAKLGRREATSQPIKYFAKNRKPFSKQIVSESIARRLWHELSAAQDVHIYLRELAAEITTNKKSNENPLANALREVALLDLIAKEGKKHQRALIHIASIDETRIKEQRELAKLYKEFFATQIGLETEFLDCQSKRVKAASVLLIQGSYSFAMCKVEQGTHLFYPPHENLLPVQVNVIFLATEDDPKQCLESFLQQSRSLLPVVRVYNERGSVVDLRTGTILQSNSFPTFGELRAMILGALPAIDELI